ncbi:MAG: hypothetical protein HZB91_07050 [Elusimicrobia bacterium]|nr:hypothetical protein [Elusimicrobiota bacterium]
MLERAKDCGLHRKDWRFMAAFYHEQGDRERARQALTTAVGQVPARWQDLVDLADTAAFTGERGTAVSLLKRADELGPDQERRLSVAARFEILGDHRGAERIVEELSAHENADAAVLLKGAFLALKTGRRDKSLELLGRVERQELDAPRQRLLGQAWSAIGEPGKAREALEILARASMPDAGDVLDWAEVSARYGHAERTREPLSRIRADALDESQQRRLAQRWIAAGELVRARRVLEGVAGADGKDAGATLERAEVEALLGHAGRARDLLSRVHAEARDGRDAAAALDRARVLALLGRTARAKELLAQASELNPSVEQGIQIAALCLELGDPGRAARVLEALRKAPQQDARILVILADMHAAIPAREEALGLLLRAEQSHPSEEDLHRIGLMYRRLGENRRCVAVMDMLVRARPDAPAYFSDRGVCSYGLGLADAAVEDFTRAIGLDAAFLPAHSSLAAVRVARGELREALRICDLALSQKARGEHQGLRADLARTRAEIAVKTGSASPRD